MRLLNKIQFKDGLRSYPAGIWSAMFIRAVRSTGFSMSFTYLSLYLYQQRHISMTLIGLILFVSGFISGFFQIVGGILADRFGHRKMFVIFQITETFLFALLAFFIGINSSVWSIFVTSIAVTIMEGTLAPAISAIVVDVSQKHRLTESYGLMAIGGNLGWAIGPLAGGYLQSLINYAWIFGIGALVIGLSLIGTLFLPRDSVIKDSAPFSKDNLKVFLANRVLIVFCGICILFYLLIAQWGSTLSVFTVDRIGFSPGQYGLLMSISGVLIMIFQYPISSRIGKFGFRKALFLGSFLYGVGFLSLSWVRSFIPSVGSIIILVAGEMLFVPTTYTVVGKISRIEDRAKNLGILGLCATIGTSFGPLFGGFLLDKFPTKPLYVWGPIALPAFLAAVGFILWRGYLKTDADDQLIDNNG